MAWEGHQRSVGVGQPGLGWACVDGGGPRPGLPAPLSVCGASVLVHTWGWRPRGQASPGGCLEVQGTPLPAGSGRAQQRPVPREVHRPRPSPSAATRPAARAQEPPGSAVGRCRWMALVGNLTLTSCPDSGEQNGPLLQPHFRRLILQVWAHPAIRLPPAGSLVPKPQSTPEVARTGHQHRAHLTGQPARHAEFRDQADRLSGLWDALACAWTRGGVARTARPHPAHSPHPLPPSTFHSFRDSGRHVTPRSLCTAPRGCPLASSRAEGRPRWWHRPRMQV